LSGQNGQRGIVTGAASGIGKAAALRMRAEGVSVLAVDRDADGLAALAEAGCETMTADLADLDDRDRVGERGVDADLLVNAAGIILLKPITEVTVEEWRRVQTINAEAIFFLCQKIGPRMRPGGAIVNLSSSSAKLASTIEVATYAASKTTILSITRSFAYALAARPVRVNAICPGIVDTPMRGGARPGRRHARHDAGRAERGPEPDGAARPGRIAGGMRRPDLVPAVEGVRLHDRAGHQLHRRHGDMVSLKGRKA